LWAPEPLTQWSVERYPWASGSNPAELTPKEWSDAVTAVRQAVLLAAGGVLAAVTLFLSRIRDAIAAEKHELDRDANRTDRYTEAVELLGNHELAVRLGGIVALGRLAKDSPRDSSDIAHLLAVWIRVNGTATDEATPDDPVEPDVTTALDAMGQALRSGDGRSRLRLVGLSLGRFTLDHARAARINFSDSLLDEARFFWAWIPRANFANTSVRWGVFAHAVLHGANFAEADLRNALFGNADISSADFSCADLSGAEFMGALANSTNFRTAKGLTPQQLGALGEWDTSTEWPPGFTPVRPTQRLRGHSSTTA